MCGREVVLTVGEVLGIAWTVSVQIVPAPVQALRLLPLGSAELEAALAHGAGKV